MTYRPALLERYLAKTKKTVTFVVSYVYVREIDKENAYVFAVKNRAPTVTVVSCTYQRCSCGGEEEHMCFVSSSCWLVAMEATVMGDRHTLMKEGSERRKT